MNNTFLFDHDEQAVGDAMTTSIRLVLWLNVLACTASLVYLLRALGCQCPATRLRNLMAYLRGACTGSRGTTDDLLERLVRQVWERRRLERTKFCAKVALPVLIAISSLCVLIQPETFTAPARRWGILVTFATTPTVTAPLMQVAYLSFCCVQKLLSKRSVELFYIILMTLFVVQLGFHVSEEEFMISSLYMTPFRFWLALAHGDFKLTCTLNLAWCLATSVFITFSISLQSDGEGPYQQILEIALSMTIVGISYIVESATYSEIRFELQGRSSSSFSKSTTSLLNDMCDVVVQLSENLHVREACPQLAAFLLRTGSMLDVNFYGLLENGDQVVFKEMLQQIGDQVGERLATTCSARLRDGTGNLMTVRFHCAAYRDLDDSKFFILGMTENGQEAADVAAAAELHHEGLDSGIMSQNDYHSDSSECCSDDASESSSIDFWYPELTYSSNFRIISWNEQFAQLCSRVRKEWSLKKLFAENIGFLAFNEMHESTFQDIARADLASFEFKTCLQVDQGMRAGKKKIYVNATMLVSASMQATGPEFVATLIEVKARKRMHRGTPPNPDVGTASESKGPALVVQPLRWKTIGRPLLSI